MLNVRILISGDVEYRCVSCPIREVVGLAHGDSPFWDVYNGQAALRMLEHFRTTHMESIDERRRQVHRGS